MSLERGDRRREVDLRLLIVSVAMQHAESRSSVVEPDDGQQNAYLSRSDDGFLSIVLFSVPLRPHHFSSIGLPSNRLFCTPRIDGLVWVP